MRSERIRAAVAALSRREPILAERSAAAGAVSERLVDYLKDHSDGAWGRLVVAVWETLPSNRGKAPFVARRLISECTDMMQRLQEQEEGAA